MKPITVKPCNAFHIFLRLLGLSVEAGPDAGMSGTGTWSAGTGTTGRSGGANGISRPETSISAGRGDEVAEIGVGIGFAVSESAIRTEDSNSTPSSARFFHESSINSGQIFGYFGIHQSGTVASLNETSISQVVALLG